MAFRFRRKESVADGIRRVVREQTALAVSLLADQAGDVAENIHEARRCIKRLRATLRVVRQRMDEDTNDAANIALRDASRKLSGARDADVSLAVFETLASGLDGPQVARIQTLLEQSVRKMRAKAITVSALAAIAADIRSAGHGIVQATLNDNGWPLIAAGIHESYARSRHTARRLRDDTEASVVHEWRKVTKSLFFQLELVRRSLAKPQKRQLRLLEKLGLLLGEHHDLDTLRNTLAKLPRTAGNSRLNERIDTEVCKRLKRARRLAREIFAARNREFISSIRSAWNEWRE